MKYPLFTREIESREYYGNMAEDAESKYVAITDTFGYVPDIKTAEDVVKHFEIESTSKFTVFYNRADEGEVNIT